LVVNTVKWDIIISPTQNFYFYINFIYTISYFNINLNLDYLIFIYYYIT
jgi:hypothetical protein